MDPPLPTPPTRSPPTRSPPQRWTWTRRRCASGSGSDPVVEMLKQDLGEREAAHAAEVARLEEIGEGHGSIARGRRPRR